MDKSLRYLGIAKRAGMLAVGAETANAVVRAGKACAVISACDSSEGSMRRSRINAEDCGVLYCVVPFSKFELGNVTGRGSPGTLAILDAGIASAFFDQLAEKEPERYAHCAEYMKKNTRLTRKNNKKRAGNATTAKGRTAI